MACARVQSGDNGGRATVSGTNASVNIMYRFIILGSSELDDGDFSLLLLLLLLFESHRAEWMRLNFVIIREAQFHRPPKGDLSKLERSRALI